MLTHTPIIPFRYHNLVLFFLLAISIFGCSKEFTPQELDSYLKNVTTLKAKFSELKNLSANHPELKQENIEKAEVLLMDFESAEFPRCTKKLHQQVIKAMQASLEYLDPAGDNFYDPSQLSKFAMDEWDAVDKLILELTTK